MCKGSVIVEDIVEVDIGVDETEIGVNLFDDLFSFDGSNSDEVDQPKKKWLEFNLSDMNNPTF